MRGMNSVIGFAFLGVVMIAMSTFVEGVVSRCRRRDCAFSFPADVNSLTDSLSIATATLVLLMLVTNLGLRLALLHRRR